MKKKSGFGIRDTCLHPGSFFRELQLFGGVKILKFFDADQDPDSGSFRPWIRDKKILIQDKHHGFVTLYTSRRYEKIVLVVK
jgi:hypothetical protein